MTLPEVPEQSDYVAVLPAGQGLIVELGNRLSAVRRHVKGSDAGRAHRLLSEVLQNDHSVLDFIHADYTMANERLAKHYGLRDVNGIHFRGVSSNPQHRRGGLLTQAGLLAMNSDGKDSHPLKRGIWMLESLLNDPPPPPPPAVPEIDLADPEIAKLTLKQRIENHRDHAACMSCHAKIDPWGIAFENFDAVGSWRTEIQGKADRCVEPAVQQAEARRHRWTETVSAREPAGSIRPGDGSQADDLRARAAADLR